MLEPPDFDATTANIQDRAAAAIQCLRYTVIPALPQFAAAIPEQQFAQLRDLLVQATSKALDFNPRPNPYWKLVLVEEKGSVK